MHFPVGKVKTKILSIGVNRHRIAIGALTKVHLEEIRKSSSLFGSFILPMAAPDYLFEIGHDRLREIPEFPVIGYLGKATSSGHSNGLIDFLNQIKAAQDRGLEVRFWFAGIESQNIEELSTRARELGIEKKYLKISGHVPHEMVSKILSEFDFGLIPYPESTYNSYRFPIKSVEYAASQIPIIATTTTSNLHILNPRISLFYDPNTPLDFVLKLEDILNNPSRIVALRQNALTWATSHTYQNRVLVASDAIRHLINVED
jgi:glycosyltransferase involved in cell wall biosynthesis